jgi:hypothetical protein
MPGFTYICLGFTLLIWEYRNTKLLHRTLTYMKLSVIISTHIIYCYWNYAALSCLKTWIFSLRNIEIRNYCIEAIINYIKLAFIISTNSIYHYRNNEPLLEWILDIFILRNMDKKLLLWINSYLHELSFIISSNIIIIGIMNHTFTGYSDITSILKYKTTTSNQLLLTWNYHLLLVQIVLIIIGINEPHFTGYSDIFIFMKYWNTNYCIES